MIDDTPPQPPVLTVKQASLALKVDERTMLRWLKKRDVEATKIGAIWRVRTSSFLAVAGLQWREIFRVVMESPDWE